MLNRRAQLLLLLLCLNIFASAQPQVTVSLITDQGVKNTDYLNFSISNGLSTTHNFTFDEFSKDGKYANTNLYQYSRNIDTGIYKVNITLQTSPVKKVVDTLLIRGTTTRIEIFVYISTNDVTGDFIKEVKTLYYQADANFLVFSFIDKPKIGSKAVFNIQNVSNKDVFSYPNSAFFFGTLYEEIDNNSWIQHYPLYIDIKYCDTMAAPGALQKGQTINAWTPNKKDCTEYKFEKKGNYFFSLLYTTQIPAKSIRQGMTIINRIDIYRQILEFKI